MQNLLCRIADELILPSERQDGVVGFKLL